MEYVLICPKCGGDLVDKGGKLVCADCKASYDKAKVE